MVNELVCQVNVRIRWWVYPYLGTLKALCALFGAEPNIDRVAAFVWEYGIEIQIGD